jgi:hypothetical protein
MSESQDKTHSDDGMHKKKKQEKKKTPSSN